jgi:transcriptional regulator with XRE-family HTH domain
MRDNGSTDARQRGHAEIGVRLAEARRGAGMTQTDLARRLGVSLWTVEQLELGRGDFAAHERGITNATGTQPNWFREAIPTSEQAPPHEHSTRRRVRRLAFRRQSGRDLVLVSISLLVLIRFFTEIVPILPRAANFIDIPLFVILALAGLLRSRSFRGAGSAYIGFAVPVFLFLALCAFAVTLNPSRVEPGPVLVFLYGFLAPIGVYAAAYRLWPAGNALRLSRLLVALAAVELLVVFLIDLPRFISSSNPDVVSGTFGTNAYQLVFFLLVVTGLIAGIFTLEKGRLAARFAPLFFVLLLGTILLAQYRALLVTTGFTVILIAALLRSSVRGVLSAALVGLSLVFTFSYVASHFPILRFSSTLSTLKTSPGFYASKRLHAATAVGNLYSDNPRFMITGTGPGTFSSRAWGTFAFATSRSRSNVQGRYVAALTGAKTYQTDVSDKYVLPTYGTTVIQGSTAVTSPFASYLSLLAEVGLPGFLLLVGMYFWATARALKLTAKSLRRRAPRDPLPALLLACSVAFTVLLQMALFDNWLEVTRLTFLSWMLLAVCSKEIDERARASE